MPHAVCCFAAAEVFLLDELVLQVTKLKGRIYANELLAIPHVTFFWSS
jgi:hypothetical protein